MKQKAPPKRGLCGLRLEGLYGNQRTDHAENHILSAGIDGQTAQPSGGIYKGNQKEPGLTTLALFFFYILI